VGIMSTGSIFNSIKVTDKHFCSSLVKAMEESKAESGKKVIMSKQVTDLNKDAIKKMFGE